MIKLSRKTYSRLVNKYLEPFGTTLEEIENKEGVVEMDGKKKVYWYQRFFHTEETFEEWRKDCLSAIRREFPSWNENQVEEEFMRLDSALGLPSPQPWKQKEVI